MYKRKFKKPLSLFLALLMPGMLLPAAPAYAADEQVIYQNDFEADSAAVSIGNTKALEFDAAGDVNNSWLSIFQKDLYYEYTDKIYSGAVLSFDLLLPAGSTYTGVLKAQAVTKMGSSWTWTQSVTIPEITITNFTDLNNGYKKASVSIPFGSEIEAIQGLKAVVPCLAASNCDYTGEIYLDNVKLVNGQSAPVDPQLPAVDPITFTFIYVTATKAVEAQTAIAVSSGAITANGQAQKTSSSVKMVDDKAIRAASQLYAYLEAVGKTDSVLFGHQNDITHKSGNPALSNSDVKDVTGSISAVMGIDALSLTGNELSTAAWNDTLSNRVAACEAVTKAAADQGAIITISAHMPNFDVIDKRVKLNISVNDPTYGNDSEKVGILSDGHYNFSGYTPNTVTGNVVTRIMPGQDLNYLFTDYLDMIAAYAKALEKDNISVLFRPFHENTGSWFWWGAAFCDAEAYKNLYKYTVEYLRDVKEVHNFIYVYGPSSDAESIADYGKRYPGDDYVDMVGFDMYHQSPAVGDNFIDQFKTELNIVQQFAEAHGKLFSVTETGVANPNNQALLKTGNARKDWFNEVLDAVAPSNASYFLVWANFGENTSIYTPYVISKTNTAIKGHEMLDNFIDFYNDPRSVFASDTGDYKQISVSTSSNSAITGYITAPVSGSRILTAQTITASVSNTSDVSVVKLIAQNKTGSVVKEIPAAEISSGKYTGDLTGDILTALGATTGTISLVVDGQVYNTINAKFNMPEPVIDPTVVDTFEDYYGEDAVLNTSWSAQKGTGCTITPSLSDSRSYDGSYSVEFKYSLVANGYAGMTKNMNGADWSGKNALQLWTIPDGKNQKVVVQVTSGSNAFEVYLNEYDAYKSITGPVLVTIPFSSFVGRDNKAAVFDATNIQSFGLWCNAIVPAGEDAAAYKLNAVIYYDSIKSITSDATSVTFTKIVTNSSPKLSKIADKTYWMC